MKPEDSVKMLKYFPGGISILSLTNPLVYGFFTEEEPLKKAIESFKEDKSLYFIGH